MTAIFTNSLLSFQLETEGNVYTVLSAVVRQPRVSKEVLEEREREAEMAAQAAASSSSSLTSSSTPTAQAMGASCYEPVMRKGGQISSPSQGHLTSATSSSSGGFDMPPPLPRRPPPPLKPKPQISRTHPTSHLDSASGDNTLEDMENLSSDDFASEEVLISIREARKSMLAYNYTNMAVNTNTNINSNNNSENDIEGDLLFPRISDSTINRDELDKYSLLPGGLNVTYAKPTASHTNGDCDRPIPLPRRGAAVRHDVEYGNVSGMGACAADLSNAHHNTSGARAKTGNPGVEKSTSLDSFHSLNAEKSGIPSMNGHMSWNDLFEFSDSDSDGGSNGGILHDTATLPLRPRRDLDVESSNPPTNQPQSKQREQQQQQSQGASAEAMTALPENLYSPVMKRAGHAVKQSTSSPGDPSTIPPFNSKASSFSLDDFTSSCVDDNHFKSVSGAGENIYMFGISSTPVSQSSGTPPSLPAPYPDVKSSSSSSTPDGVPKVDNSDNAAKMSFNPPDHHQPPVPLPRRKPTLVKSSRPFENFASKTDSSSSYNNDNDAEKSSSQPDSLRLDIPPLPPRRGLSPRLSRAANVNKPPSLPSRSSQSFIIKRPLIYNLKDAISVDSGGPEACVDEKISKTQGGQVLRALPPLPTADGEEEASESVSAGK